MNPHLQRAMMLLEQSRHEMAADELRQALAADPDDPMAHAVLAICLSYLNQHSQAVKEAETSIHLLPDQAFPFYAHSIALANRNQFAEAKEAIATGDWVESLRNRSVCPIGSNRTQPIELARRHSRPPTRAWSWIPKMSLVPTSVPWPSRDSASRTKLRTHWPPR